MNEYGLIKIFGELYATFQERHRRELIDEDAPHTVENYRSIPYNLGFLTPYENTAAGRKRQATADAWADNGSYSYEYVNGVQKRIKRDKPPEQQTRVIKNEMLAGFKLAEEIRRTYWGGGNVVWRIEDPRGFEMEISSSNFARIITECGIEPGGIIPGKCIYGRVGGDNILIPDGSELWKQSHKDAEELERKSKSVSKNLVQIGSMCELKNGQMAVYLGQFYATEVIEPCFSKQYNLRWSAQPSIIAESEACEMRSDRFHAFKMKQMVNGDGHAVIVLYKDKKVVTVHELVAEHSDSEQNRAYLNSGNVAIEYASAGKHVYATMAFAFTNAKPVSTTFVAKPIVSETLKQYVNDVSYGKLRLRKSTGYGDDIIAISPLDGRSLSSIDLIITLENTGNKNGLTQWTPAKSVEPDVIYGVFYSIQNNKLIKSVTFIERDGYTDRPILGHKTRKESNRRLRYVDLLKDTVKKVVDTQEFEQLFLVVDDVTVALTAL